MALQSLSMVDAVSALHKQSNQWSDSLNIHLHQVPAQPVGLKNTGIQIVLKKTFHA